MSELLALPYTDRITDKSTKTVAFKGTEILLSDGYYQVVDSYTEITWNLSFSKLDEEALQEFLTFVNLVISTDSYVSWTPVGEDQGIFSLNSSASSKYGKTNREFNISLVQKLGANYEPTIITPTVLISHTSCSDDYTVTITFPVEVPSFTHNYLLTPYLVWVSTTTSDNKTFVLIYNTVTDRNREGNYISFLTPLLDNYIIEYDTSLSYTVYSYLQITSVLTGILNEIEGTLPKTILPADSSGTFPYIPYITILDRVALTKHILKVSFTFDKALTGLDISKFTTSIGSITYFDIAVNRKSCFVLVEIPLYIYRDDYQYVTISFTGVTADISTVLTCTNKTNPNSPGFLVDTCPYVYYIVNSSEKLRKYRLEDTGLVLLTADITLPISAFGIIKSANRNAVGFLFNNLPGAIAYQILPDENYKLELSYLLSGLSSSDYGVSDYSCDTLAISDDGTQICFMGYSLPHGTTDPFHCILIFPRIGSRIVEDEINISESASAVANLGGFLIPYSYYNLAAGRYGMCSASYELDTDTASFTELTNGSDITGKFPVSSAFGEIEATLFVAEHFDRDVVQPADVVIASYSGGTDGNDLYLYSLLGAMDNSYNIGRLHFLKTVKGNYDNSGSFQADLFLLYGLSVDRHLELYQLTYTGTAPRVLTLNTTPYYRSSFAFPNVSSFDVTADSKYVILGVEFIFNLETRSIDFIDTFAGTTLNPSLGLVII